MHHGDTELMPTGRWWLRCGCGGLIVRYDQARSYCIDCETFTPVDATA
jgi:hypothetical protein